MKNGDQDYVETQTHQQTEINTAWYFPILEFAIHALVGTIIFLILATPAVGLNLLVHWLESSLKVEWTIIWLLKAIEYAVILIDGTFFIYFLGKKAWNAAKKI
jgi:hypothetical protein